MPAAACPPACNAQENLQALLVDIHEDPEGFKEFVEVRSATPTSK